LKHRDLALVFLLAAVAPAAMTAPATNTGEQFTTFAGFDLLRGTLADVQNKLGKATEVDTGDAGELRGTICYRMSGGHALFLAGEMHWGERRLDAFGLEWDDPSRPCNDFPPGKAPAKLEIGGIHLGMTRAEFERVVGPITEWHGDEGFVEIDSTRPMTPADLAALPEGVQNDIKSGVGQKYFDIGVSFIPKFDGDKLKSVEIWKTETY
jgi:hypothetical protein